MGEINMLVAKFVDNNYKYDNFGISIEKEMLVLPINEDVDINRMRLDEKAILLEISEKNIVDCQRNTYFYVNEAIPIRYLNDEELSIIRNAACQYPKYAYKYALYVDKKPTNETKSAACKNPYYAYRYAYYIDKKPTNETRNAACNDPYYAYYYAVYVDQKPTDETRTAACQYPEFAYMYALEIDKKPTDETRSAVSKIQYYKEQYAKWEKSIC
jgi:hypothetical protein